MGTAVSSKFSCLAAVLVALGALGTSACAMNAATESDGSADSAGNPASSQTVRSALPSTVARPGSVTLPEPGSPAPAPAAPHENGEGCGADFECRSGFCSDFVCADPKAPEYPLHADGEGCGSDEECASGYCLDYVCSAAPTP